MTCRKLDETTRKLLSPEHVFLTTRPNKYRDAIIKMVDLMESKNEDIVLRAAEKIINHTKGTPKQAIEHSGKMEIESPQYDFSRLTIEQQRTIRDAFRAAEKKQS